VQLFSADREVKGLIFDMDSTLYENPDYAADQLDSQIRVLALRWQRNVDTLRKEVYRRQAEWTSSHGGRKPSFGNLLLDSYGISIEESVKLREEAIEPERWLGRDEKLVSVFQRIRPDIEKVLLTNNPSSIARRSLRILGVDNFFSKVVGLDTTLVSKPHAKAFIMALDKLGVGPQYVLSIGDRWEVDIEPALALGMGGILVESIEDTYCLADFLAKS